MLEIKDLSGHQKIPLRMLFALTVVVIFSGAIILEITSGSEVQAQSLMQESKSSSTSCIKGQQCQTMICSDTHPCQVIQSPNGNFDTDKSSVHTTPEDPILMSPNPYVGQPSID